VAGDPIPGLDWLSSLLAQLNPVGGAEAAEFPKITIPRQIGRPEPPFRVETGPQAPADPNVAQADSWSFYEQFGRPGIAERSNRNYSQPPRRLQDPYAVAVERQQAQKRHDDMLAAAGLPGAGAAMSGGASSPGSIPGGGGFMDPDYSAWASVPQSPLGRGARFLGDLIMAMGRGAYDLASVPSQFAEGSRPMGDPAASADAAAIALSTLVPARPPGSAGVGLPNLWHGAARPLEGNRFDPNRIGSGEGYHGEGAGGYASESRPVAEWYQRAYGEYPPELVAEAKARLAEQYPAGAHVSSSGGWSHYFKTGDEADLAAFLKKSQGLDPLRNPSDWVAGAYRNIEDFNPGKPGALYEMRYQGADTDHFLRWDLPLKDQSAYVRKNLERLGITEGGMVPYSRGQGLWEYIEKPEQSMADMTGRDIYEHLGRENALDPAQPLGGTRGDPAVAQLLRENGIRGTRYPASEFPGNEGKFNYSIFQPENLNVYKKYGVGGAIAGAGALAAGEAGAAQPDADPLVAELRRYGIIPPPIGANVLGLGDQRNGNP